MSQENITTLIISIIIVTLLIILIVIMCCNWKLLPNDNPQAAAALYKNKFEQCGWNNLDNGSVQCCGKSNGVYCTHNQKRGQCAVGYCDITCGGGTSACRCAHDGATCSLNQVPGSCDNGKCYVNIGCIGPITQGYCQTMECITGDSLDICARYASDGDVAGYCESTPNKTSPICIFIYDDAISLLGAYANTPSMLKQENG